MLANELDGLDAVAVKSAPWFSQTLRYPQRHLKPLV